MGRTPVGCLTARDAETIRLREIYLLPKFQSHGVGSFLIHQLLDEASGINACVALGVFKINDNARRLYERHGFRVVSETDTHFLMEARPTPK